MKMCKRCGVNPVPQGRWAYCSEECLSIRSFNRPEDKVGVKQRFCKRCGVAFVIQAAGQVYCKEHLTTREEKKKVYRGTCEKCGAEWESNKPNRKFCDKHRANTWKTNQLLLAPMARQDREMLIRQILRQYGRKPQEWDDNKGIAS